MSRAYRLCVRDNVRKVIRASDHVSTQLEMLEILPPEQMAELLAAELERQGFKRSGATLSRQQDKVRIEVDPASGAVTVRAQDKEVVTVEGSRTVIADEDWGRETKQQVQETLRRELRKELEGKAEGQTAQVQSKVTQRLESQLGDIRKELDQVVNRVTAEALKRKAAQLGQIKSVVEDAQSGSLTIVVEV